MGQTTDQIAAGIDHEREELKANIEEIESRVKSAADWRDQFRRRPGVMLAVALAGGALLCLMVGRR